MSREEEEYIVSDGMKQIPIKWTAPEALNFGKLNYWRGQPCTWGGLLTKLVQWLQVNTHLCVMFGVMGFFAGRCFLEEELLMQVLATQKPERKLMLVITDLWKMWRVYFTSGQSFQWSFLYVLLGYRMPSPDGTPEDMYRLMLRCWETEPHRRPHFHQIYTIVDTLYNTYRWKSCNSCP